jgi:hypothetical protein
MYRSIITLAVAVALGAPAAAQSQEQPAHASNQAAQSAPPAERRELSGPRFGFTVFTGDVANVRQRAGKEPLMTQFGWQAETQITATDNGSQALMEWIALVGGVEQDELNLSLSWLAGYRVAGGLELGAGPALSISKDNTRPRTSMVIAGGATAPFGQLRIPFHVAVALAEGGPRITTLVGWIID